MIVVDRHHQASRRRRRRRASSAGSATGGSRSCVGSMTMRRIKQFSACHARFVMHYIACVRSLPRSRRCARCAASASGCGWSRRELAGAQRRVGALPRPARDRRRQHLAAPVRRGRPRARHLAVGAARRRPMRPATPRRSRCSACAAPASRRSARRSRGGSASRSSSSISGSRQAAGLPLGELFALHGEAYYRRHRARGAEPAARRAGADGARDRRLDRQRSDQLRAAARALPDDLAARARRGPLEPRRRAGRSAPDGREPARVRRAARAARRARDSSTRAPITRSTPPAAASRRSSPRSRRWSRPRSLGRRSGQRRCVAGDAGHDLVRQVALIGPGQADHSADHAGGLVDR